MRSVFPIESRDKCPSSSLQHGEARERNAVAVAHREGPPGHRCHGAARTSPTFATVAIQQSAGAAGAFECAGRAGRLPVLAIPGARQPRGQRCIAATATPPPHGRRQQCRRQPPHPAAAASCRQHCSDSSLLPRRRRGHECHRHVPRVPPPSASPWPLPPPGGRERGSICVYEVCVWRLSLPAVKPPPSQPSQGRTHLPPFKGGFEVDETSSPRNNEKRKKRRGTSRNRRLHVGHTMAALQTRSGSCQ